MQFSFVAAIDEVIIRHVERKAHAFQLRSGRTSLWLSDQFFLLGSGCLVAFLLRDIEVVGSSGYFFVAFIGGLLFFASWRISRHNATLIKNEKLLEVFVLFRRRYPLAVLRILLLLGGAWAAWHEIGSMLASSVDRSSAYFLVLLMSVLATEYLRACRGPFRRRYANTESANRTAPPQRRGRFLTSNGA